MEVNVGISSDVTLTIKEDGKALISQNQSFDVKTAVILTKGDVERILRYMNLNEREE